MKEVRAMAARLNRLCRAVFAAAVVALASAPAVVPVQAVAQARHAQPQRGDYLPPELLRAGPNVDFNAARLRRPPEGYGWFQVGTAYCLASLASGLILEVVGG
jgi:hypothetical protein